jgi:predicted Zn-dependent protease
MSGVVALIAWAFPRQADDHWEAVARARRHLQRGQTELAFQAVAGIRDEKPGAAEGLAIAGQVLLQRGNVSAARRVLELSLKIKPDQADAAKMLAAIYLAGGGGQRAVTLLKRAAQLEPHDFRPWYALGKVYHDLGNLQEAADAYAETLKRSPPPKEARDARIGRIRALLDSHRAVDASADLQKIRKQAPDDPEVLALAARHARDLGRLDESLELANRALARDPKNFDACLARARACLQLGEPKKALDDLERAVVSNPNDLGALQLLAQVQQSVGLTDDATATRERSNQARARIALMDRLTKTIDQHPDDPEPRFQMGQAAMEGEMYTLAYQCFRAALDIDPNFRRARDALEALRSKNGFDYQAAVKSQLQR